MVSHGPWRLPTIRCRMCAPLTLRENGTDDASSTEQGEKEEQGGTGQPENTCNYTCRRVGARKRGACKRPQPAELSESSKSSSDSSSSYSFEEASDSERRAESTEPSAPSGGASDSSDTEDDGCEKAKSATGDKD